MDCSKDLHLAAEAGLVEAVKELLEAKANPNARNFHNNTPLHLAAFGGKEKCAAVLLEAKADVNAENDVDQTPLDWALFHHGKHEMIEFLQKHGGHHGTQERHPVHATRKDRKYACVHHDD